MLAAGFLLVAVTVALALADTPATSPWRHAYLLPVAVAGLRRGVAGGMLASLAAVLLFGPTVLREIERGGLTPPAADGIVAFGVLLATGGVAGRLAERARRSRADYEALVAAQRAVAEAAPLPVVARRLRAALASRLRVDAVGVVLRDGDGLAVAGADRVHGESLAARALAAGTPLFAAAVGADARARRALAVPLTAGDAVLGVVAVERLGDLPAEERQAFAGLVAAVGLALDNARLAARQRQFADELARKVEQATARLAEMDRLKTDFVALASHELRTPLTGLQGFSELLASRDFVPTEVRRMAAIMRAETERLGRIVSDFLDLARLERGLPPPLRRAPIDPAPVIAAAVELFRRTRVTHELELHVENPLPTIDADADALDRVLKNLIGNAVKYAPPGTRVSVSARAVTGGLVVDVEDEGPGVAATDLGRIFEPYYRSADAARVERGAGLGLAVVKALIEGHGGWIRAERGGAAGLRMTFTLPAVP